MFSSLCQFFIYPRGYAPVGLTAVITCSNGPAWGRLINSSFITDERISLITSIFSDPAEIEVVCHLSGDDAQNFIDAINEVSIHRFLPL